MATTRLGLRSYLALQLRGLRDQRGPREPATQYRFDDCLASSFCIQRCERTDVGLSVLSSSQFTIRIYQFVLRSYFHGSVVVHFLQSIMADRHCTHPVSDLASARVLLELGILEEELAWSRTQKN